MGRGISYGTSIGSSFLTIRDAISLRERGIIQLGLLLLILTPIAWVAFSVYAFATAAGLGLRYIYTNSVGAIDL